MAALSWSLCCFHLAFLEAAEADWALRESPPLKTERWRTGNQKHLMENSMGQCAEACQDNTGELKWGGGCEGGDDESDCQYAGQSV